MKEKIEDVDFRKEHASKDTIAKMANVKNLEIANEELVELVQVAFVEIKDFFTNMDVAMSMNGEDIKLPGVYISNDIVDPGAVGGAIIFPAQLVNSGEINDTPKLLLDLAIKHELIHYFFDHFSKVKGFDEDNLVFRSQKGTRIHIEKVINGERDRRILFDGLNEGLTNFIAVILTYKDVDMEEIFRTLDSVKRYVGSGYPDETLMVYKMWQIIAKSEEASGKYVFKLLLESMTNSNPEFFHLVKAVYGKGAVKFLSKFRVQDKISFNEMSVAITNNKIRKFFEVEDKNERNVLRKELIEGIK